MISANDSHDIEDGAFIEINRQLEIPLKAPMFIFGAMMLLSYTLWITDGIWYGAVGCSGAFTFWWFLNVFPNRRYRIAWDNVRIYMREGGFKRSEYFSIAFDEIKSITTAYDGNAGAKARFFPFDYIEIRSRFRKQKPIIVHPPSLNDGQLKTMLLFMYEKNPVLFSEELVDFMNSEKPL